MKKTYYSEDSECGMSKFKAELVGDDVVILKKFGNKDYFEKFVYSCDGTCTFTWKHGGGEGSMAVPFDLLSFLTEGIPIIQDMKKGRVFAGRRIYDKKPISEMFE